MNSTTRLWLVAGSAALAGALIGAAGAVAYMQRNAVSAAEVRALKAGIDERDGQIELLTERYNEAIAAAEPTSAAPETTVPSEEPSMTAQPKTARQYAYISKIKPGDPGSLVADYAEFLTGAAASRAAAAHGDESPPPNDFYIVNDNPKLRTLPVAVNATVTLVSKPADEPVLKGYSSDLKTLSRYLTTENPVYASIQASGFWLTLEDGIVSKIEEQFVP